MSLQLSHWKTSLRTRLERYTLGYRILLKARGASFQPDEVSVDWMNTTLKSEYEWQVAVREVKKAGLHPHPDGPKNWDGLAALSLILKHTSISARILDAGGEIYSPITEWLYLYGYKFLHVINLSFDQNFIRGPIRYVRGDCTDTSYPSEYFDVITCLSVIEHGVDVEKFLKEAHRILRSGGFLILSTDYWKDPIETNCKEAYGTKAKIFTPEEIQQLVNKAVAIGFIPTGEIDYSTEDKVVHWKRLELDFTFIVFTLVKA